MRYDLAVVLIVGRKKDGRAELAKALEIEPQLKLDPDFATDEVRDAYRSIKSQGAGAAGGEVEGQEHRSRARPMPSAWARRFRSRSSSRRRRRERRPRPLQAC